MGLVYLVRRVSPVASSFSHHTRENGSKGNADVLDDEAIIKVLDDIMQSLDNDGDGYIDYIEYKAVMTPSEPAASDSSI